MQPMVDIYARIFRDAVADTIRAFRRAPSVLLVPMLLMGASHAVEPYLQTGPAGAWAMGVVLRLMVLSACIYFIRQLVQGSRASVNELPKGLVAGFSDALGPLILGTLVTVVLFLGLLMTGCLGLLLLPLAIVTNPMLEVAYFDKGHTFGGLLEASADFLRRNWIPWALLNGLLFGLYAAVVLLPKIASFILGLFDASVEAVADIAIDIVVVAPLFFLVLVMRAFIFAALDKGTHRSRVFQFRAQADSATAR